MYPFLPDKSVCFTGHRPEKLPDNICFHSTARRIIQSVLYYEILIAIKDGYDTFITGMQRGIDLWAAEIVMELKAKHRLKLAAVLPYAGMGESFSSPADKWLYNRVLSSADEVIPLSEKYHKGCMSMRNRFMVEHSSRIIAVIDDEKSGTGQTLRYAEKKQLELRVISLKKLFSSKNIHDELSPEDLIDFQPDYITFIDGSWDDVDLF